MSASDDEDRTVFVPGGTVPPVAPSWPGTADPAPASSIPSATAPPASTLSPGAPRREGSGIREGDVLNHIFEVRRFIARGGMGEVFEGVNVNSEERVAIKVMLPALAADPNIQAMFRKEARTLTRLSNPALVQYRVLAQEPQLDVLYIVTEFIDGANLCDLLGTLKPSADQLIALTRRLATGLEVAHTLGAIHRDISPDNVLLEDGRLDRAKVIDFGIAKDLDPSAKTVVGDGFAGKLGYVAPEQLGDFNRQIGPWTDVYSLGLVILAVASGRNPDLSGSFVDAIEKRRRGPDLAGVPDELAPTLARMLVADPSDRLRSMDAVLDALKSSGPATSSPAAARPVAPQSRPVDTPRTDGAGGKGRGKAPLIGASAALIAALLAGIGYVGFGHGSPSAPASTAASIGAASGGPQQAVRASVERALPGIACSWLDVTGVSKAADGATVTLAGAAGDPAAAQAAVASAVSAGGGVLASSDFSEVAPIHRDMCDSIDAFRSIRTMGANTLSVAQRKFEMSRLPDGQSKGQIGARAVLNLDIGNAAQPFAFYGIEPSGEVQTIIKDRKELADYLKQYGSTGLIIDQGGDRYRIQLDVTHTGWSGFLLLTGHGGFPDDVIATKVGQRPQGWRQRFAQAAAIDGWKAQMAWVKTVDELPN